MDYVVTTEQMRFCDRQTSAYFQIPETVLMERAALAVAEKAFGMISPSSGDRREIRVLVLCGSGNNGADGYAAARLLKQKGARVCALFCGETEKRSPLNRMQGEIAQRYGVVCGTFVEQNGRLTISARKDGQIEYDSIEGASYDLVIDALYGIGLSRPIEGSVGRLLSEIGTWRKPVLAADMPSGIDSENGAVMGRALAADQTVTFGFMKIGLMVQEGAAYTGSVSVADIGITADSFMGDMPKRVILEPQDIANLFPERKENGNKGTFGKLLLMAGSPQMSGACTLAALAAYRAGAGMVRVVTCHENVPVLKQMLPEALITVVDDNLPAEEKDRRLLEAADWADVVAAGCGIGTSDGMWETVRQLYDMMCREQREKPLILDADALNLISRTGKPAEFLRTITELKADFVNVSEEFAAASGCILAAKEARTYLCMADEGGVRRGCFNLTGNDGMATAGAGDVLTGMIAAMAAVVPDLFDAACVGVYLHGLAGTHASEELGKDAVMASDIVRHIPGALQSMRILRKKQH